MNRRKMLQGLGSGMLLGGIAPTCQGITKAEEQAHFSEWGVIAPGIWKSTIGVPEPHTPVRARRIPPDLSGLRALPQVGVTPLTKPKGSVTSRGVELELELAPDELMYGFGLQLLSFQQRGKKRTIRVNADPKGDSGDSHAPVPFYVTTRGYGILVDTFRHADFYVGDVYPKPVAPQKNGEAKVNLPDDVEVHDGTKNASVRVEIPRSA